MHSYMCHHRVAAIHRKQVLHASASAVRVPMQLQWRLLLLLLFAHHNAAVLL
jgi:hypothetical protein